MKLINPSFEIIDQYDSVPDKLDSDKYLEVSYLMEGMIKHIERIGRTAYKSEDKITETSAQSFVKRMIDSQHYATLEHGTLYLIVPLEEKEIINRYVLNPYSKITQSSNQQINPVVYITTNYRVLIENNWMDDLYYISPPTDFHEKRVTVHFTSDIHFYKDITRHRVFSYLIESTRFCNYIKDKFGGSITFITPVWLKEEEKEEFEQDLQVLESLYFKWIKKGWQPQQAAYFLCQGTKADIMMTGFVSDYLHFFDLRALGTTGAPHPTVKELVYPLMEEFKKRELI